MPTKEGSHRTIKMATPEQIARRRKSAYQMILQGLTPEQIAKQFGCTSRLIQMDVKKLREDAAKQLGKIDYMHRIADYNERQNERIKRLWGIIAGKDAKKSEVLKALSELRSEDEQMLKKDQMVGILPKEQSPLTIETNTDGDGISNIQINIIQQQDQEKAETVLERKSHAEKSGEENKKVNIVKKS